MDFNILDQAKAILKDAMPPHEAFGYEGVLPGDDTRLFVAYHFAPSGDPVCAIYIKPAGAKCGSPDCDADHENELAFGMTPDHPFPMRLPIGKARAVRRLLGAMPFITAEEVSPGAFGA